LNIARFEFYSWIDWSFEMMIVSTVKNILIVCSIKGVFGDYLLFFTSFVESRDFPNDYTSLV